MRRKWIIPILMVSVFIFPAMSRPDKNGIETCAAFLSRCGYEKHQFIVAEMQKLPNKTDAGWEAYLVMQAENGFNMEPYGGKTVMKYTFSILNYPFNAPVYANLYWVDEKIIGGDIMSPALDGFMHGLPFDLL